MTKIVALALAGLWPALRTSAFHQPSIVARTAFGPSSTTTSLHASAAPRDDVVPLDNRRAFLLAGPLAAATAAVTFTNRPSFAASTGNSTSISTVDYKAVAADVAAMVTKDPDRGPTLVRLAWHSSGTYDKMAQNGGSGSGTLRFKEELAHGANAGLADTAVQWMNPIQAKYAEQGLSFADLYTLGGGSCRHCILAAVRFFVFACF